MTFEDVKGITIQAILDEKESADKSVTLLYDNWKRAKKAFLDDCDRVDAALSGERENLRSEVEELTGTIKRLSGQLAAGITGSGKIDKDLKENLRRLIREATAKREEAQATLDGLEEVQPEYNRELFSAAIAEYKRFLSALRGSYADKVVSLCNRAETLCKEAERAKEAVRNRVFSYGFHADRETEEIEKRMKSFESAPETVQNGER